MLGIDTTKDSKKVQSTAKEISDKFMSGLKKYPGRTEFGGYHPRPGSKSDHAKGKALDVHVPLSSKIGNRIAKWARKNAKKYGIKYIIWNGKIWSASKKWKGRKYTHPTLRKKKNVDLSEKKYDTLQHRDHVHLSFK